MTPRSFSFIRDPFMISSFRRSARSWAAGAILFIALIAIVVTGFGTDGMGGMGALGGGGQSGTTLVSVAGKDITDQELSDTVNREYNQARQQQPTLDMRAFLAAGAFDQLLTRMIIGAALQYFGEQQGLIVSQRMIDREIVNIPAFRNFAGQFDESAFRQALQQQNVTEAQLREDIARSLMQRQLLAPIALGVRAPEGVAREYANLLLERRQGSIGVIPTSLMLQGINPTNAQIAAFYQQNRDRFTIPERRVIRYAIIGPQQIGQAARATDQEIQAYYRQNAARFAASERRTLQHLVLQSEPQAQQAVQQLRGGSSFAEVASRLGFAAADLTYGDQTQPAFAGEVNPEVARAAFAAAQGAVVGPIRAGGAFHVVRVDRVAPGQTRTLEQARAEIVQAVEQRKAAALLNALVSRVEDRVGEGEALEAIARAERLNLVTTPPITQTGQVPGQQWIVPPELQPLLNAAFEMDPDDLEPVVEQIQENQRFALVGVEQVVPAAPPPLAQILPQVREALVQQQALDRARQVAQAIVNRINGGMAPAQAFAQAQPRPSAPQSVNMQRLEISQGGQQVPAPLLALFSIPQGRARIIPAPNGAGWFVVHHAQRTPGNAADQPQLIGTTRTEFSRTASEEIAQQVARAVELRTEIERNPEAQAAARRQLLGSVAE